MKNWVAVAIWTASLIPAHAWTSLSKNSCLTLRGPNGAIDAHLTSVRISTKLRDTDRRDALATMATAMAYSIGSFSCSKSVNALDIGSINDNQKYSLKFPTLFAPLYGEASRKTIKRSVGEGIFVLEQNLELGPLQTPLRCTVIRLKNGTLWVHAPLAPTQEFFEMVESCGESVAHVIAPTYALEHKVFVKDALQRWPDAQLWTSPNQFSFPFAVSNEFIFGKDVSGVLTSSFTSSTSQEKPSWTDEIEYASLEGGTFNIGGKSTTLCETAFFHKESKSLIVTDAVARISTSVPPLNDPEKLLLISKRSTSDPMPEDTPQSRLDGWEKTALLVSYFFPEHEEFDPDKAGVVTWTEGWHENFNALAGRLIVPPVVRTLIYSQNPSRVQKWVNIVSQRFDFDQIIPAHFDVISATPKEFAEAFRFLEDETIDAFPENDMARGLKPIADIALKRL